MAKVVARAPAKRDLIEHTAYLVENAGDEVALRFLDAAEQTFADLLGMPKMGTPQPHRKFPLMRRWRVHGFEKYLIFYQSIPGGVEILRVIHSSRDIRRIFPRP